MELSDDDWDIITATGEVLEDLEDVLMTLEGDGAAATTSGWVRRGLRLYVGLCGRI
jgi:hypothetical protein